METLTTHSTKNSLKHMLHITQVAAVSSDHQKFFRSVIDKTVNTASDSIREKLNIEKKSRMNFVFRRNKTEVQSVNSRQAFEELISFCECVKTTAKKVCLVTYRRDEFKSLGFWLDKHSLRNKLRLFVDNAVTLENIFEEKPLKQFLPLASLAEFYKKTVGVNFNMKNPCAEDVSELLMKSSNHLMKQQNFVLFDHSREIKTIAAWKELTKEGRADMMENMKIEANTFTITNSITFTQNELFHDSGASTSKVTSQAPKNKNKDEDVEIIEMDVDEDNFEFVTVGQEILYQVLCQPILVKLGTMDENTKFIKFSLSKQMMKRAKANKFELLNQSARVFWRNDKPFAFCNLCPDLDNDTRYKPVKAKIADTIFSDLTLGSYKPLNRTDEDQRYLSTKVLADIIITKAGNDNTKVGITIYPNNLNIGWINNLSLRCE